MIRGLPEEEYFVSGHRACAGCGCAIAMRHITKAAGPNTIVVNATGCMEVVSTPYPETAWKLPYIHGVFGNAAPIASGIYAALKKLRKKTNILVIGGDGATYDIGFGALSAAFERGDKFTYICYDNEAYMNTGYQRSGATPFGAWTSTTPVGEKIKGKRIFKKPIENIFAEHNIPYIATANIAFAKDMYDKVKKSFKFDGPSFINIFTTCQPGWKHEPNLAIRVARLAVETGLWPLYEIENGKFKLNMKPKFKPIEEYLRLQGRFKHLSSKDIGLIKKHRDKIWKSFKL